MQIKDLSSCLVESRHSNVFNSFTLSSTKLLMFLCGSSAKYIPPQDQKPRLFKKAEFAKKHNRTEPERAVLNIKINRKKKNCMLKTSQEARVISKLQKKSEAMSQKMAELGVTYEIQVSSVLFFFSH